MSPFTRNTVVKTVEDVKRLAERLSKCPDVARFDEGRHKEAWALAHSFADLEDSCRAFLDEQLPKLTADDLNVEDTCDQLQEIGEEFRHILYHILEQQQFYKYLVPEKTAVSRSDDRPS
jgi:hypothetical protein